MHLDLRLPIGMIFTIYGVILTLYGLASDDAIYARSLDVNVNLWWGLVLLGFGLVMLRSSARIKKSPEPPTRDPRPRGN